MSMRKTSKRKTSKRKMNRKNTKRNALGIRYLGGGPPRESQSARAAREKSLETLAEERAGLLKEITEITTAAKSSVDPEDKKTYDNKIKKIENRLIEITEQAIQLSAPA